MLITHDLAASALKAQGGHVAKLILQHDGQNLYIKNIIKWMEAQKDIAQKQGVAPPGVLERELVARAKRQGV